MAALPVDAGEVLGRVALLTFRPSPAPTAVEEPHYELVRQGRNPVQESLNRDGLVGGIDGVDAVFFVDEAMPLVK